MPEYDAFGREIGEDTLQSWREGSGAAPPEPAPAEPQRREPAPAAVTTGDPLGGPAVPQPTAPRPPVVRPRRRRRGMARLVVLLFVAWILFNVISGIAGKVDEVARTITIPELGTPQEVDQPAGLEPGSLLRPAEFEHALTQIRRRGGGKLENLRVAPERVFATLLTRRGTLVNVQVAAHEGFRKFSESGPGFTASDTVPFSKLDPRVPQRLVTAAAERLGVRVNRINYLVPSLSDGKAYWGAYFKTGAIFLADARGKIIRRIS